jgi:nitrogenase-associated protein
MARILFYEKPQSRHPWRAALASIPSAKPGCAGNLRQKRLLEAAGHTVITRNLLTEPWTAERLRDFFGTRPVAEWFNRNAPKVKSGELTPERIDALTALALMLADPLLIRRPLLEADGRKEVGFDPLRIHAWLGLSQAAQAPVSEACARDEPCPAPGKA